MSGWLARAAEAAKKAANKAYEAAAEYAADDEDSEAVDPRSACFMPSKPYLRAAQRGLNAGRHYSG